MTRVFTGQEYAFLDEHKAFYKDLYADDDDQDQFYDRTGRIGHSTRCPSTFSHLSERKKRTAQMKKEMDLTETYDTLVAKEKVLSEQVSALNSEVRQLEEEISEKIPDLDDELGIYMKKLSDKLRVFAS